jgi:chromosome segregation ATPase
MKVTAISVTAGRTFNHPFEQYANLRFDMHLDAQLEEGEEFLPAIQKLTAQAEELAEGHKQNLLKDIRTLEKIQRANREISDLEERMAQADSRLKDLRQAVAAYQQAPAGSFQLENDEA